MTIQQTMCDPDMRYFFIQVTNPEFFPYDRGPISAVQNICFENKSSHEFYNGSHIFCREPAEDSFVYPVPILLLPLPMHKGSLIDFRVSR
jgi:hypothetical protein